MEESENSGKQKLTARQEGVDVRRRHVHVPGQRRAPHRQVDRVARRDVVLLQENVHVLEERDRRGAVHDKAGAGADHVEVGGAEPAVGAADVALDGAEFGAELGAERAVFFCDEQEGGGETEKVSLFVFLSRSRLRASKGSQEKDAALFQPLFLSKTSTSSLSLSLSPPSPPLSLPSIFSLAIPTPQKNTLKETRILTLGPRQS